MTKEKALRSAALDIVELYLIQDKANKSRLAAFLGYRSTYTIDQWILRKAVPIDKQAVIMAYIHKALSKASASSKDLQTPATAGVLRARSKKRA